jgi:MFS family permease
MRSSWALFAGIVLMMLGNGLQTSLLGLRAAHEGFSTTATGAIMSAFYIGFLAGSALTPKIVRDVGHIRVFAAWSSMASVSILLHGLFVEPVFWGAMRFITGFCYAGIYVVAESWINDRADNKTRGALLSMYMVSQYVGLSGGQLLLNLSAPAELTLFVLTSILISVSLIPIALTTTAPQPTEDQEALPLLELYRLSPLGVVSCAGAGLSTGALLGMGAVFAEKIDLSLSQISVFMAMLIVGAVCMQFPIGRISDFFDRRKVIIVLSLIAVGIVAVAWSTMSLGSGALYAMIFLVGGSCLPLYALGVAYTNDDLRPGQMVAASSSLVLVFGLAASLGPIGIAASMNLLGPAGFYVGIAIIHGLIALFAIYRSTQKPPRDPKDQDEYLPLYGGRTGTGMPPSR